MAARARSAVARKDGDASMLGEVRSFAGAVEEVLAERR